MRRISQFENLSPRDLEALSKQYSQELLQYQNQQAGTPVQYQNLPTQSPIQTPTPEDSESLSSASKSSQEAPPQAESPNLSPPPRTEEAAANREEAAAPPYFGDSIRQPISKDHVFPHFSAAENGEIYRETRTDTGETSSPVPIQPPEYFVPPVSTVPPESSSEISHEQVNSQIQRCINQEPGIVDLENHEDAAGETELLPDGAELEQAPLTDVGFIEVIVTAARSAIAIADADISISRLEDKGTQLTLVKYLSTNQNGKAPMTEVPAPSRELTQQPGNVIPFTVYLIQVAAVGYYTVSRQVEVFGGTKSILPVEMIPLKENLSSSFSPPEQP